MRPSRATALAAVAAFLLCATGGNFFAPRAADAALVTSEVPDTPPGLVVTVADHAASADVAARLGALGTVEDAEPFGDRHVRVSPHQPAAPLGAVPGVAAVEDDAWAVPAEDPRVPQHWYLRNEGGHYADFGGTWREAVAGADIAWDEARPLAAGGGVVVAVVDSGVQFDHPELAGRIWSNPDEVASNGLDDDGNGKVDDVQGWDFAAGDANPGHEVGDNAPKHGTHIAGTIAAVLTTA